MEFIWLSIKLIVSYKYFLHLTLYMTDQKKYLNINKPHLNLLLVESKNGSKTSFNQLSIAIREIVYSYFFSKHKTKKIKTIEEVEDLTNNVYLAFAEQYQGIINIENWLRKVMFIQFISWYKKEHKHQFFQLDESMDSENKSGIDEDFTSERVIDCLNKLDDIKKNIIKLKFWAGLKFKEIAQILSKNENAIKKMYYRTLEELKKICD